MTKQTLEKLQAMPDDELVNTLWRIKKGGTLSKHRYNPLADTEAGKAQAFDLIVKLLDENLMLSKCTSTTGYAVEDTEFINSIATDESLQKAIVIAAILAE